MNGKWVQGWRGWLILTGIGFGVAAVGIGMWASFDTGSPAWASHRHAGRELGGSCGEGSDVNVQNGFEEPLEFPTFLFVGDNNWNLIDPTSFDPLNPFVKAKLAVKPGLETYVLTLPLPLTGTCTQAFQVTGIAKGESFVIEGPCVTEIDTKVEFTVKLVDKKGNVEEPEPETSPAGLILERCEFRVKKKDGTGMFRPYKIKWFADKPQGDVIVDGDVTKGDFFQVENPIGPMSFIDPGLYELEVVWKMPAPPDGFILTEVNRVKLRVEARRPGGQCDPPNTIAGLRCRLVYNTIDVEFADPGKLGVTGCNTGGGFKPRISPINIANWVKNFIYADTYFFLVLTDPQKNDLASDVQKRVEKCVLKHEEKHVKDFSDPLWNVSDACDDCCCDKVPGNVFPSPVALPFFVVFPEPLLNCTEKHAFLDAKNCYQEEKDDAANTYEREFFKKMRNRAADRAGTYTCP